MTKPMEVAHGRRQNSAIRLGGNLNPSLIFLGMVVVLGYFYFGQDELIDRVKRTTVSDGRRLLVSTSYGGNTVPKENVVRAADYLLLHGNGVSDPKRIAELEGSGNDMNGIVSLALIRMVMNLALDMVAELGVDAPRHAKWRHTLAHLGDYPTMNHEKTGKPIFRYTERGIAWWPSNTIGIQHIYPPGSIGLDSPPELLERSRNMIDALGHWIDYNGMNSFYPAAARVGYPPETILAKMKDMLNRVGGPNGMVPGNPHVVELFSIVPNTIQEMLMQSHEGVIRFFPCWPQDKPVRFGTLRARGAFLVSAGLNNGEVSGVKIVSEKGRDCTVQNPWPGKKVNLAGRETLAGDRFTFQTKPGEVINLEPEYPGTGASGNSERNDGD